MQARSSPSAAAAARASDSSAVENWLANSARRADARNALLVVKQGVKLQVLAFAPKTEPPDRSMLLMADRALQKKKLLVRAGHRADGSDSPMQSAFAGFALRIAGRPAALVLRLEVSVDEPDTAVLARLGKLVLRRAEDQIANQPVDQAAVSQQLPNAVAPTKIDDAVESEPTLAIQELVAEQTALLTSVTALVDQSEMAQSLHTLANEIASQFRCQRVFVGCRHGRGVVVRAVSRAVDFDVRSALMVDVAQAMNETKNLARTVRCASQDSESIAPPGHASLAELLNQPALISVPLPTGETINGVLLLERDRPFTDVEAARLERLALLLAPMLALKTVDAMGAAQWLRRYLGRGLGAVFGSRRMGLKLFLLALALLIAASSVTTRTFRVDADAAIEATVQRAVVSSFPSFLAQVEKRPGDLVTEGELLAQLDVEDLHLDRISLQGEKEKLTKEYRATLAQRDRSKVRVLEAQRAQTQAQIDLIDAQIERALLRSPIDGVVISGDLFQALGKPVDRGELLFEVASLADYRLVLTIDEKDIGWVQQGSQGQLRLRSMAQRTFPFEVTAITPVSEAGQGANVFRVEASLDQLPPSLRPGMGGVAKIDVEPRAVGWIWTRSFVNWVRMQLWRIGMLS